MDYIKRLDEIGAADLAEVGGKAANLGELVRAGLPVPDGFVLGTAAYRAFVDANGLAEPTGGQDATRALFRAGAIPDDVAADLGKAYDGDAVAVRSSATAEDLADASFAGQQDTYLNVRGADRVRAAVVDCWASLWTDRAMAYRAERGIPSDAVALAVVVQRMVHAESSGVMFTANPANGRRDQLVISAAWGLGESVVGGMVSTDDHVVDRATGRLVSRRVADKAEMTVYSDTAGTEQRPVPADRMTASVLDDEAVAELARLGARIEQHFGAPQDVEWARAGGRFHIVQSRPITALPEPTADVPTDWTAPDPDGWYFRASIVEQMPDPLTPLFADMIDGAVSRSLSTLVGQTFGSRLLRPGDLGLPTINGYAYYFYRTGAMTRIALGAGSAIGAMAERAGIRGWREWSHPKYRRTVDEWSAKNPAALLDTELLDGVRELLDAGCEYYTAVQSIIPLAATSELVFRGFYDRLVRRPGDPAGETFLLGFDSRPIQAEKSLHDLAVLARADDHVAAALTGDRTELRRALRDGDPPPALRRERGYGALDRSDITTTSFSTEGGPGVEAWLAWRAAFQEHLDRYGHTVYNLDFADPVPADDPAPLLDAVRFHLSGAATNPYERQRAAADRRDRQTRVIRTVLDPARRAVFDRLLRFAQETGPIREDALADMGLAWPTMRRMLLELGDRLVATGTLSDRNDVFWLRHDELRSGVPTAGSIADRKALWRGRRQATAPQVLPAGSWMDRLLTNVLPARDQHQTGPTIRGIGAGSGRVTAPARVLTGPADFAAMRPGEVLVARITTPAWTPLFAMAAAVVTDVGGPLSHSSIVAREYGIPAVLGTGAATGRIRTGQQLRVDGDAGTVTLLDELDTDAVADPAAPDRRRIAVLAGAAGLGIMAAALLRRRRKRT